MSSLDQLRRLLHTEYMRHECIESPWTCFEEYCPRFGKSVFMTGCECRIDFENKHVEEVKRELALLKESEAGEAQEPLGNESAKLVGGV